MTAPRPRLSAATCAGILLLVVLPDLWFPSYPRRRQ